MISKIFGGVKWAFFLLSTTTKENKYTISHILFQRRVPEMAPVSSTTC
jgi:hypothetical protein